MDEARQRMEWQQTAAIVCMAYNVGCDTRKGGALEPVAVHAMAGPERPTVSKVEAAGSERAGMSEEDAKTIAAVFGNHKTVYKVKR